MTNTTTTATASVMIERAALVAALDVVGRVVERRNTIPILSCVVVEPNDAGGARLYATDMDCSVAVDVAAVWEAPRALALDAFALIDAVKAMGADTLELSGNDTFVTLQGGAASIRFAARAPGDMPRVAIKDRRDVVTFAPAAADWRALMLDAARFVSTQETRYYLNGICLAADGDKLAGVATHGHGMFVRRLELPAAAADVAAFAPRGFIMPRKACALVSRIISRDAADNAVVSLFRHGTCSNGAFTVRHGAITVTSKEIDGSFPDWRRVVPGASDKLAGVWSVAAGELVAFAKGAAASAKKAVVAMRFAETGARSSVLVEGRPAVSPMPGAYIGDACDTGATLRYLADVAGAFHKDATLDVAIHHAPTAKNENGVPFVVTSATAPRDVVVLMPARAEWREAAAPALLAAVQPAPGAAANLFDVVPFMGMWKHTETGSAWQLHNGPREAKPVECAAYLRDMGARCGFPALEAVALVGTGVDVIAATFGELVTEGRTEALREWDETAGAAIERTLTIPAQYQPGAHSVLMPGRRAAPVLVETLDDAGAVVSCDVVAIDAKGAVALGAAAVATLTALEPVKARKGRKAPAPRKARAAAVVDAETAPAAVVETPASPATVVEAETVADVPQTAPAIVEEAPAPVVTEAAPVDASAPAVDLAAIVLELSARVAALEAGNAPAAAAPIPAATRAPRAARERLVRAYLRHRAERDAIREERAAFRREMAEMRADVTAAHAEADGAKHAARLEAESAREAGSLVRRAGEKRDRTAARLKGARAAIVTARRNAFAAGRRAQLAETQLAGAQLASAAAWERVAALQLDREPAAA